MAAQKNSMRGALKRSLEQENEDFDRRFEQAERMLGGGPAEMPPTATPRPESTAGAPEPTPTSPVERVVRDTFTMPRSDQDRLQTLQERCLRGSVSVSRSELVRAGLRLLQNLDDGDLLAAVQAVEKMRTGRPKRG